MENDFYRELLNNIAEGVYFVDRERRVTFWNKGAERISGYTAQEVIGSRCADNILRHVDVQGNPLCANGCPLLAVMEDGAMREAEVFMHHKHGHRMPVVVRAVPMRDASGSVIGAAETFFSNVKNINVLEDIEKLRQEALADPLTGVGNRRYADIRLQECEETMRGHGVPFGVLFVDLDHFKRVNDTWGHEAGDKVLRMAAQTLASALRTLDAVCRWGGEEFVVVAPNITFDALRILAERLRMLVENSWLDHEGERISVTASFGAAVSRQEETAAQVVSRADRQVYMSKEAGRNRVHLDG